MGEGISEEETERTFPYLFGGPLNMENVKDVKGFGIISIFIYSKVDKEVIAKLPGLKMIATRSTGFDHIDLGEEGHRLQRSLLWREYSGGAYIRPYPLHIPKYSQVLSSQHNFLRCWKSY